MLPAAKLSLAKEFHVTLKFLGEISLGKADDLKKLLMFVKPKKFSCSLSEIWVFPSEINPRVIWAAISPEDEFLELQKQIDLVLENEFPKEKDFKPHITLARVKQIDNVKAFMKQMRQILVKKIKFDVNSFKLKKSKLTMNGAVHEDIAKFELLHNSP
jgi:RNA 2',3'-cyclic 3'-phosphodiesterase